MRYVIIPLAIIIYIYWTYISVKDLIQVYKETKEGWATCFEGYTEGWLTITFTIFFAALVGLTVIFW